MLNTGTAHRHLDLPIQSLHRTTLIPWQRLNAISKSCGPMVKRMPQKRRNQCAVCGEWIRPYQRGVESRTHGIETTTRRQHVQSLSRCDELKGVLG
jgi:hypothetical protein